MTENVFKNTSFVTIETDGFDHRHRAFMIVIFSAKSSTTDLHEPKNSVKIVYEALTKYDTPTCHEKVFVLEGGLYEWSRLGWLIES